jgi:hypothetical protein
MTADRRPTEAGLTQDMEDVLLAEALDLAQAVVSRMEAEHPETLGRYGPEGRAHCVEDTVLHVQHLAAALSAQDATEFRSYRSWLGNLLRARGIPEHLVDLNLRALQDEIRHRYGERATAAIAIAEVALR